MISRKRRSKGEAAREAAAGALRESGQDLRAVAADPAYQQMPPRFHLTCRKYARRKFWTLHESACLFRGFHPDRPRDVLPGHGDWDYGIREFEQWLERSSLWLESRRDDEYLRAAEVIEWALLNCLVLPRALLAAMGHNYDLRDGPWVIASEFAVGKRRHAGLARRDLRYFANKVWLEDDSLRIKDVLEREDKPPSAKHYEDTTQHEWIKDLCPIDKSKRGGRRPGSPNKRNKG